MEAGQNSLAAQRTAERWTLPIAIVAATLFSLALRVWGIADLGDLDFDEQASYYIGAMPPHEMLAYLLRQPFEHPPLFYLLFHAWLAVAGGSETAMRLFAVVPGALTVPIVGVAVARVAGGRAGTVAAWVLAVAPLHVYYSRDARMYSLLGFLGAVALAAIAWGGGSRSGQGPYRRFAWLVAGLAAVAAVATHYYVVFLLLGVLFGLARGAPYRARHLAARASGIGRRPLLLIAVAAIVMMGAVWLGAAAGFRTSLTTVYPRPVDPQVLSAALASSLAAPLASPLTAPDSLPLIALGVVAVLAASLRARGDRETALQRIAFYGFVIPTIGIPLLLLLGRPFAPRYVVMATPFLAALVGFAAARLPRIWIAAGAVAVIPLAILALAPMYGGYTRSDYGRALGALRAEARPDDVIVLNGPWQDLLFRRYGTGLPTHTFVATTVPLTPEETLPALARVTAAHPRIWVVDAATDAADPNGVVAEWLDRHAYPMPVISYEKALIRPYLTDVGRPSSLPERPIGDPNPGVQFAGVHLRTVTADAWQIAPGGEARLRIRAVREPCGTGTDCRDQREERLLLRLVGPDAVTLWHWDGRLWPDSEGLEYRAGLAIPRSVSPGRYPLEALVYEAAGVGSGERQVVRMSDPIEIASLEVLRSP
jgi:hypothetical protein